ncbi:MAG: FkbM family methyltransferase [Chloroflexota bacterium]|nr:FkbM family methyltransferase [Chloroflexota bacterium]
MTLRKWVKYLLYGFCPGFAGRVPYFGTVLFFPRKSITFRAVCEQGIFEADNVRLLQILIRPNTWLFDVGANIGLMSAPVLHAHPSSRVLAFEPSPNVLPYLQRSITASPFRDRWAIIPKAVGANRGQVRFSLSSPENNLFDGLRSTSRVEAIAEIEVEMTTLDFEWERLGCPSISVIKCDVEGAETQVMAGAQNCIKKQQPAILLEWNAQNLKAYDYSPDSLLSFTKTLGYGVYAVPSLTLITTENELQAHMGFTESFLLLPR